MTTDPAITIAGLSAERDALASTLRDAIGARTKYATDCAIYEARLRGDIAAITAERDALAAQLTETRAALDATPKPCAIHSYGHGPGPCLTCGAWPPGTRERIARLIAERDDLDAQRADVVSELASEVAAHAATRDRLAALEAERAKYIGAPAVSAKPAPDRAAIERAVRAYHDAPGGHADKAEDLGRHGWKAATAAMEAAFAAAGVTAQATTAPAIDEAFARRVVEVVSNDSGSPLLCWETFDPDEQSRLVAAMLRALAAAIGGGK